jgi:lysophospholipase L1-like esterase
MLCIAAGMLCGETAAQDAKTYPNPTPRIAVVGDSWGMFEWWFRSYRKALVDLGYERYIETANESVVGGGLTFQFVNEAQFPAAAQIRAGITRMLEENPTIDVVVVSLGGNDVMQGTKYVLPDDPEREIEMQCPGDPNEFNEILLQKIINQDLANLVNYILAVRPDIRVLLTSYDYAGIYDKANCDLTMQQSGFMIMDIYKQRLADALGPRVHFVSSYGLMQFIYGVNSYEYTEGRDIIPESETPVMPPGVIKEGFTADDYPPLRLPDPEDVWTFPWTREGAELLIPGFPQYHSPLVSLLDREIHLTEEGYDYVAHRIVDRVISTWLDYPKAFEIMPLEQAKGEQYQFEVTFSEPVSGVDATDFEVATAVIGPAKIDISNAQIINVQPAEGFSQTFTVTVDLNPGVKKAGTEEVVHIHVLDDDSIVDEQSDPLGGPNEDGWNENGKFTFYGPFAFVDLERPAPGDFPAIQHYLDILTKPYMPLINFAISFDEKLLDLNGNIIDLVMDLTGGDVDVENLYVKGNGLLEAYEFALMMAAVNNPELDLSATGGVTHQIAKDAWDRNLAQMQYDLGGAPTEENPNMLLEVLSGLDSVLAGYFTLGEPVLAALLTMGSGILLEQLSEFIPGIVIHQINMNNYTRLPEYFGAYDVDQDHNFQVHEFGDADGDGYTNAVEYLYFEADGKDGYIAAALDPNVFPPELRSEYAAGESLRLYVPELLHVSKTTYQWYKDGVPIDEKDGVRGTRARTLDFASLVGADSGEYTCIYNENAPDVKGADVEYGPITITVTGLEEGEGIAEGEGNSEGEGTAEGATEGAIEGAIEGATEGTTEGSVEGAVEGSTEGITEGSVEGVVEGATEGVPEGSIEPGPHTADQNADGRINLTELLRVIQFFNIRGFSCVIPPASSEDGFLPGLGGDQTCAPHASDYAPQNWQISLTELLRLIQFFNVGGYHACPEQSTEDGYCPGLA